MVKDLKIQMEILMICLTYLGKINNYMKKTKYIILLLSVIFSIGCREEELFKTTQGDIVVTANFASTRTTFIEDDGVTRVKWNKDDAIGLITEKQNNLKYKALNEGSSCKFETCEEKIQANEGETVYAYYPYTSEIKENKMIRLPNIIKQQYNDNNTAEKDFIYAIGNISNNELSLRFKHIFAFLKINVPLYLFSDNTKETINLRIEASDNISSNGTYFDLGKETIIPSKYDYSGIAYDIMTKDIKEKNEIVCYVALFPQKEGTEINIYYEKDGDPNKKDCLYSKKVPQGGFKAGNVYTVYLNENQTEITRKKERDALIAFYKATNGDNWKVKTNWCSELPVSEWYGVNTYGNGLVSSLYLGGNNLSGILPEEIGNLEELKTLFLMDNKISGEIPNSISNTKLGSLALGLNQITGNLSDILNKLEKLKLTLSELDLKSNQITGNIPPEIGEFSNLWRIILSETDISGEIPSEIGKLTKLAELWLSNCKLIGDIPPEVGNMVSLERFAIDNSSVGSEGGDIVIDPDEGIITNRNKNQISGSIPQEICNLRNLRYFNADGNKLSGNIPAGIWELPHLKGFTVSDNDLSGNISENIGKAKELTQLFLYGNNFTGELPQQITQLLHLEDLQIAFNSFTGKIPDNIGSLQNLRSFVCGNNLFTGNIPQSICELQNLEWLDIGNADYRLINGEKIPMQNFNKFNGYIPENIGNLQNLRWLSLGANQLSGNIPESLYDLSNVEGITLSRNLLDGSISEYIGNLSNLDNIALDGNNLTGVIPKNIGKLKKMRTFNIENNHIEGTIPKEVANLNELTHFWIYNNNIEGEIPIELLLLPKFISLSARLNRLEGTIPASLIKEGWNLLPQQDGYNLTIDYTKSRSLIKPQKMVNKYQIGNRIIYEEKGLITVMLQDVLDM